MPRCSPLAALAAAAALLVSLLPADAHAQRVRTTRTNLDTTPSGAEVFLVLESGEQPLGVTPLKNAKIPRGMTTLRFKKDGFQDLLETIEVTWKTQSYVFNLLREIKPAQLEFIAASEFYGAKVFVDDQEVGVVPTSTSVPPGRHYVKVVKEGYEPWERWIDASEAQKVAFDVVMKKVARFGSLLVASTPSGAQVRINGAPRGVTPTVIDQLSEDNYLVEVVLDGYPSHSEQVRVTGGQRATINVDLAAGGGGVGRVRVSADVEGATIFIDGEDVGAPPVAQEVTAGKHVIEARAPGYTKDTREVEIGPGETLVVTLSLKAATERAKGSLRIIANVQGALVSVNGGPGVPAPHQQEDLSPGTHFVTVSAPGYATWQKSVTLPPGGSQEVVAELTKAGRLEVKAAGGAAEVFINGKLAGKTPFLREDLEVGTYEVMVKRADGKQEEFTVAVGTAKPVSLNARFGAKDRRVRHRAMALSAQPIDRGYGTMEVMLGFPTLAGLRISGGLTDELELGLTYKSTFNVINEFEARAKYLVARSRAFAFSGEGGLGFGLGGEDRNSVFARATALGSILISERAAITARASLFMFTDRTGPETLEVDGEFPHLDRDTGAQLLLGVSGEFRISKLWNVFFVVEGDPFKGGRSLYDQSWSADPLIYTNVGLSLLF